MKYRRGMIGVFGFRKNQFETELSFGFYEVWMTAERRARC
ncbi:hypothetical protein C7S16_6044 [Burkholderia thailandensis]|uniref:Transposase n=1 Tax=Burkholderia thailandensis TaxID=57975 RepID=A0AAW9CPD3_BURTH|nr:hypothetical protein [Burkholderia thailandensis]MDW9252262.1 hypothetical protein [Burkholderia thailandensis]